MVKKNRISYIAIITGITSALYFLESFFPMPLPIPGARWGFSNFPLLYIIINGCTLKEAFFVAIAKTFLGTLFSGRLFSPMFWMGISGSVVGVFFMFLFNKFKKLSVFGISEIGALFNNTIQIIVVGIFFIQSKGVLYYYPYMLLFGMFTAFLNAMVVFYIMRSYKK